MKLCWANYLLAFIIIVFGTASMLSACGKKGPLYLPGDEPQATQQQTVKPQDQDKKEQEDSKTN